METLGSKGLHTVVCGIALSSALVLAAEPEKQDIPDREFLEYLGMWEESDEDWQLLNIDRIAEDDERNDPAPEGEESTESEDEC